jgi:hypothetical protein
MAMRLLNILLLSSSIVIGQEIETIDDTSISSMESVKSKIEANTTNEDSKINQNKDQQTGSNIPENVEFEPSYYEAYDYPLMLPSNI